MKNFEIWFIKKEKKKKIQNRCVWFVENPGLPSSELSKLDWLTAESSAAFSSSTTKQESGVTLTFLICKYKTARGDIMKQSSDSAACRLDLRAACLYLALSPSRQTFSKITRECKQKKHHWQEFRSCHQKCSDGDADSSLCCDKQIKPAAFIQI